MLNAYSVDNIIITQSTGVDEWGEPNAAATVSIKGYAQWKTRLVMDINGEEVPSTITIYINKRRLDAALGRALSHEDRIEYVNDEEINKAIINISTPKAFSHPHYEIALA